MRVLLIILVALIIPTSGVFYLSAYSESGQSMMTHSIGGMMGMCQSMMNSVPQDVIIKTTSSQVVKVGEESKITLLVTDKAGNLLDNADVILHIEEGTQMASMDMSMIDMMGKMIQAENIDSGQYQITFTPAKQGYYTMHIHVIPHGKSMMSMMNNHMDIGIIVKNMQ